MQLQSTAPAVLSETRAFAAQNGRYTESLLNRGRRYLPHISQAIEARGIPGELALLPAIESGFNPNARSPHGAIGLWQFMPGTAEAYGLKHSWWYDGRRDLLASTKAALDYLDNLNRRFEGNWLLAIAAYNCGEGTTERILKQARVSAKAADLWALLPRFPKETQRYVPKLLALSSVIRNPAAFGVKLPKIPLEPKFEIVGTGAQIELLKAAELAGVQPKHIYDLNPAFPRWATDPDGPHRLLVPVGSGSRFITSLKLVPPKERVNWQRHTILQGESLSVIALRYGLRVKDLMVANNLNSTLIRAGAGLLVPMPRLEGLRVNHPVRRRAKTHSPANKPYRVRTGDSLWRIARRHNTTVARLMKLNGLTQTSVLRPGQLLRLA